MHRCLFPVIFLIFLAACQSTAKPTAAPTEAPVLAAAPAISSTPVISTSPATSLPSATATLPPTETATPTPLPASPTPRPSPTWHAAVDTLGSVLPGFTSVALEDTWYVLSDQSFQSVLAVPYQTEAGYQFALVGQPHGKDRAPWDGLTHTLLWNWSVLKMEPSAWKMIARPLDYGAFLGQDAQDQWWLVYFPVPRSAGGVMVPLANPQDFHIRFGWDGAFVRDGGRLVFYRFEGRRAVEQWSTDNVPAKGFELASANEKGDLDPNGDGRTELVLHWGSTRHPLAHIYQVEGDSPKTRSFTFIGEMPARVQSARVQDGRFLSTALLAYLAPDDPESPTQWRVYRWTGERFEAQETLPGLTGAPITTLNAGDTVPTLPEDLYFRREDGWYRLPASGGAPAAVSGAVQVAQRCGSADTIRCLSPNKNFLIHERELTINGAIPAVRSQMNGISTNIADILVPLGRYNAFGWAPDERFALLAEADEGVVLDRVDPATAQRESILAIDITGFNNAYGAYAVGNVTTSDPVVFPDGSYGFVVQAAGKAFYPGLGVFRLSEDGTLSRLVEIPPQNLQCSDPANPEGTITYGTLSWSTDRSSYIYTGSDQSLGAGSACRGAVVIYGRSDGSAAWDLTAQLLGAQEVHWAGEVNAGR